MKRREPITFASKQAAVRSSFAAALEIAAYLGADDPLMSAAPINSLGSWREFCERVVLPLEERIYGDNDDNDDDSDRELQRLMAEFRKANVAALVAMMSMMYRRGSATPGMIRDAVERGNSK